MKAENDEDSVQDSMVQLAQVLSHSNFNVKQFKRMHAAKPIKLSNQRTMSRLYTEHSDIKNQGSNMSFHSKTLAQGLNRTLRYVDTHIPSRKQAKFFSKPLIKSADRLQETKSKKKLIPEKTQHHNSNLQKYERQWSKGKIKERCIEEWLNAILIQYCHDEYFDKNIVNSALKKLGIDENSLVAKGLPPENVSRLYRGLFVFGMGFNSLIGELTHGNMEVLKTIWRIYSIILEYCSKGGMVTVIGEIQRETSAKVAVLTNQIVRKQQIIQKNEELNQQKNAQIFRQIKKLREDNANLNNQKTVLVQQYNSTEQAFSQEVNLRLKFQTKINQIYGLHRDLGIKHQRLFQNFSDKVEQLRVCADKYFQSTIKSQESKETQYRLRQQLILLKLSSKKQQQYLDQIIKERIDLLNKISKLQYISLQLQAEVQELKNKEKRWLNDKINMESTIEFREKSSKETHSQYQITLEENNRLYILLSDQRKVMQQYEKQKRNFNSKVISIVSQNSYHKRKLDQIQRRYEALQENYKELTEKNQQLTLDLQIKIRSEESYQSYFSDSEQSLVQMRKINIANEQQLTFLRKFHRDMDKVLKQKNQIIESLTTKYENTRQKLQQSIVQLQETKSSYTILAQHKRIAQQTFSMKQAKLKMIEEELRLKEDQLQKMKINYTLEDQRLRSQLDRALISYKNQKFERNTLNSSYIQVLKIVEKKNAAQRQLNVKISLMQGQLEKERTRFRVMQKSMMDNISKLQKIQTNLQETLGQQRRLIERRQEYQHPMIFQEIYAKLHRQVQKNIANTNTISSLRIQLQKTKKIGEQELQRIQQNHRWDMNVFAKQAQKKIEVLTNQLSFQKRENSSLKEKVQDFEMVADSYRKKISQRETSQRQEVYRNVIEQKKKQIQKMFAQIEKLQDQLQESRKANAELNLKHQGFSQYGGNQELIRIQTLRRQLEHQYNLKYRQLQRQMKQQISRKEAQIRQAQQTIIKNMSIEQILKLKELKAGELMKELSVAGKTDKFRQLSAQNSVQISREGFFKRQMARNNEDMKNRRQINRLIKQAYQYYK